MSLLVTAFVILLVFFYLRSNRTARLQWFKKLDLPGRWVLDHGEGAIDEAGNSKKANEVFELYLVAANRHKSEGTFNLQHDLTSISPQTLEGRWQLVGHTLTLDAADTQLKFDLHLFQTGLIGLEPEHGERILIRKQANNVVPLRAKK